LGKCISCLCLAFAFSISRAENEIVEAKILEVTERGFVLQVGTEPLAVDDEHDTRFWKERTASKREELKVGEVVYARVKVDNDPPILREMADKSTWQWLEKIRKEPVNGTIEKVDSKTVTVKLGDGSKFVYRATDKTKVRLKDNADAGLIDLKVGQQVFLKGRTLPTLDTWLVEVSDSPIALPKSASKSKSTESKPKVPRGKILPDSGKMTGHTLVLIPKLSMFDVIASDNRALHISYNAQTKFYFEGRPCGPETVKRGLQFVLLYKRDRFGRILATKVELYMKR
jgi:hypothetical protein